MIYRFGLIILAFSILFNACTEKDTPEKIVETRYIIAPSGLNIRSQPSPSAAAVVLLPYGTEVMVLGEQPEISNWQGLEGRWTEVQSGDMRGWAFGAFLAKEKPTTPDVVGEWRPCASREAPAAYHFKHGGQYVLGTDITVYKGSYSVSGNTIVTVDSSTGDTQTFIKQSDDRICNTDPEATFSCWCR